MAGGFDWDCGLPIAFCDTAICDGEKNEQPAGLYRRYRPCPWAMGYGGWGWGCLLLEGARRWCCHTNDKERQTAYGLITNN
jgi:hypothetical protein